MRLEKISFFVIFGLTALVATTSASRAGDIHFDQQKADENQLKERQLETVAAGTINCLRGETKLLLRSGLRDRVTLLTMTSQMCGGPLIALAKKDEASQRIARKALATAASETLDDVLQEAK